MSQVFVVPGLTRRVEDRRHMRRAVSHGLPRIIAGLLLLAPVLGFWLRTEIRHQADESVPPAVELGAQVEPTP